MRPLSSRRCPAGGLIGGLLLLLTGCRTAEYRCSVEFAPTELRHPAEEAPNSRRLDYPPFAQVSPPRPVGAWGGPTAAVMRTVWTRPSSEKDAPGPAQLTALSAPAAPAPPGPARERSTALTTAAAAPVARVAQGVPPPEQTPAIRLGAVLVPAGPVASLAPPTRASRRGHAADYRWLVGRLEQDLPTGRWFVRYADPAEGDTHGGRLELIRISSMAAFRAGECVRAIGELVDPLPLELCSVYRVQSLQALGD